MNTNSIHLWLTVMTAMMLFAGCTVGDDDCRAQAVDHCSADPISTSALTTQECEHLKEAACRGDDVPASEACEAQAFTYCALVRPEAQAITCRDAWRAQRCHTGAHAVVSAVDLEDCLDAMNTQPSSQTGVRPVPSVCKTSTRTITKILDDMP